MQFKIAWKYEILRSKFHKNLKVLYTENLKTPVRKVKEDQNINK